MGMTDAECREWHEDQFASCEPKKAWYENEARSNQRRIAQKLPPVIARILVADNYRRGLMYAKQKWSECVTLRRLGQFLT